MRLTAEHAEGAARIGQGVWIWTVGETQGESLIG
jgi:hypothetical protein